MCILKNHYHQVNEYLLMEEKTKSWFDVIKLKIKNIKKFWISLNLLYYHGLLRL